MDSGTTLDPEVEQMLTKLNLMSLKTIFEERELTMNVLAELDKDDLGRMGVKKVRDQMKIVKWIQEQPQQQQQQQQQMADNIKLRWSSDDFYPSDEEISTAVSLGMISLK